VQRDVLRRARERGVPTVLATQVLESMRTESRPTRAEVSDAATAVAQGADAIMLSGETAAGAHPVRAVQMLDAIIVEAEICEPEPGVSMPPVDHVAALCDAAVTLARKTNADAIVAVTREGRTARLLSMRRPFAPIYAATDRGDVARRLGQWWGCRSMLTNIDGDVETVAAHLIEQLQQTGQLVAGATVVLVNATPDFDRGVANFIRVRRV
jgi:pyruvate kinase